jgi:predicted HAD superfamily Cof-like phosphohydrolase
MRYNTNADDVKTFMTTFGQEVKSKPEFPDLDTVNLRIELIREELQELIDACGARDIVEVADALTDILYVTYGAAHSFGIPIDACFKEVQRSNMSKLGEEGKPIYREDGKVMKGPGYSVPDLKNVLQTV